MGVAVEHTDDLEPVGLRGPLGAQQLLARDRVDARRRSLVGARDEAIDPVTAADQQPACLQRVAVVGVADHLGEGAVGEGEHRPKGSEAVVGEATATLHVPCRLHVRCRTIASSSRSNRKARHDYAILDTIETGIVLQGSEVKSLRLGHLQMADAYARVLNGAIWLDGIHIPPYQFAHGVGAHDPDRPRKLLLHTREIERIAAEVALERLSLVPLSFYFKDGKVKVELALARGRRKADKRNAMAERDAQRDMAAGDGPPGEGPNRLTSSSERDHFERRLGVQLDHRRRHLVVAGQFDDEGGAAFDRVIDELAARCRCSRRCTASMPSTVRRSRRTCSGITRRAPPGETRFASWCQKMVMFGWISVTNASSACVSG